MRIELEIASRVATINLNRPRQRNAIDLELLDELCAALHQVRDDPEVAAIVLRGAGPVFSSGVDHTLLRDVLANLPAHPWRHTHRDLQRAARQIDALEKPVIAVLHGCCLGLGLELALACDFRVASRECVLGLPEIAFGILPDIGGTTRLVRLIGAARAKEMILTGRAISARRAERYALVHQLEGDPDAAGRAALELATGLSAHSAAALGAAKALIGRSSEVDDRTSLELEGAYQLGLLQRGDLVERFPAALAFVKETVANPLD